MIAPDPETHRPKNWQRTTLVAGVAVFVLLSTHRLNAPWTRGHEGNAGLSYAAIARHWQTLGAARLRFAQLRIQGPLTEDEVFDREGRLRADALRQQHGNLFWVSRLPFGALLQAAGPYLSPGANWSMRLVPILMALLTGLLLYGGGGRSQRCKGIWFSLCFFLSPGAVIYARQPGYEWPCLMATTAALVLYARYRRGEGPWWPAVLATTAAALLGWFGLYAILLQLVDSAWSSGREEGRMTWAKRAGLLAIGILVIILYAGYLHNLGQPLSERLSYFWHVRSIGGGELAGAKDAGIHLTLTGYLHTIQKQFMNHITLVPLLLGAIWVVIAAADWRRGRTPAEGRLVLLLAGLGLLCYMITLRAAYKHRFYVIWWLPFLATSGGSVLWRLSEAAQQAQKRWKQVLAAAFLLALLGSSVYKVVRYHQKAMRQPTLKRLHVSGEAELPARRRAACPPTIA